MKFYMIVLFSACLALFASLFMVYLNSEASHTFPSAMTNCPDNWAINPETGNCIIPSRDVEGANLGNFIHNTQADMIYEYVVNDNGQKKKIYSLSPTFQKNGAPYISPVTKQPVYHYSSHNNANKEPRSIFPAGYPMEFDPENPEASNEVDFSQWSYGSYKDLIINSNDRVTVDVCAVQSWANSNNIAWDGVTNYKGKCVYS